MPVRPVLILSVLWFVLSPAGAHDQSEPKPFRSDWLDRDVAVAERLVKIVPLKDGTDLGPLLAAIDASSTEEDRNTGFGGRRLFLAKYGGYTTCWITIFAFEGKIVALELWQDCDPEKEKRVAEALGRVWGEVAKLGDRGYRYVYRDSAGLERAERAVQRELGGAPAATLPAELKPAFRTLVDPLSRYEFGTLCYYAGVPPKGREALNAILAVKKPDLVRRALRGLNPEGRIYAAEALLKAERGGSAMAEADRKAIEILMELPLEYETCEGCVIETKTAAQILGDD